MARNHYTKTLEILKTASGSPGIPSQDLYKKVGSGQNYKDFYNTLYRLSTQGYLEKKEHGGKVCVWATEDGEKLLKRFHPERDGIWKIVVFDIPEKHNYVRVILRSKLKALHFKKWQNSIWISPYALDEEIEEELGELAKKFFVRLIKTSDINKTDDLEKLFPEK